jgi:hypothetical protein
MRERVETSFQARPHRRALAVNRQTTAGTSISIFILLTIPGLTYPARLALAQDTNILAWVPTTKLEGFETNIGAVSIRSAYLLRTNCT